MSPNTRKEGYLPRCIHTNEKKVCSLYTWLGINDYKETRTHGKFSGAIAQIIQSKKYSFSKIYLLNGLDYDRVEQKDVVSYIEILGNAFQGELTVERVEEFNPTNYEAIFKNLIPLLKKHYRKSEGNYFNQTSGTPSTAVAWILLAQREFPSNLIQTSIQQGVETIDLPFNIHASLIPTYKESILQQSIASEPATNLIYDGEPLKRVIEQAEKAAVYNVPILLLGESGTGKERFAEHIHEISGRQKEGKFIAINCGAISPHIAESELFGHVKGAFTGASKDKIGAFEAADKGTLFLDEIGELPLQLQVKILRVLQEGKVTLVGSEAERKVDVRIIAATHRPLMNDVAKGDFREDLFFRLAQAVIKIPPLRDRGSDSCLIAEFCLGKANKDFVVSNPAYKEKILSPCAKIFVSSQPWRGNVRELNNVIRRACIWGDGIEITAELLAEAMIEIPTMSPTQKILAESLNSPVDLSSLYEQVNRHYTVLAYNKSGGNKTKMAKLLGVTRPTVAQYIEKYVDQTN